MSGWSQFLSVFQAECDAANWRRGGVWAVVDEYNDLIKKETGMKQQPEAQKATVAPAAEKPPYLVGQFCKWRWCGELEYFIVEQTADMKRVTMVAMSNGTICKDYWASDAVGQRTDDARADKIIDASLDAYDRQLYSMFEPRALTMMCIAISQRRVHELRASNGMSVTQVSNSAEAIMELTRRNKNQSEMIKAINLSCDRLAGRLECAEKSVAEHRATALNVVSKLAAAEQDRDDALKENAKVMAERDAARNKLACEEACSGILRIKNARLRDQVSALRATTTHDVFTTVEFKNGRPVNVITK